MKKINVFHGENPDQIKQEGGKTMKRIGIAMIAMLALLIAVSGVTALGDLTSPVNNTKYCLTSSSTINVTIAGIADNFEPTGCPVWVGAAAIGGTLVANFTNTSDTVGVTDADIGTIAWIATPSDIEGGVMNVTCYNGADGTEEGRTMTIHVDNTAPTFTFTPADGAVVEEGNQIITATATELISGYGLTFDNQGRAVTISSDAYSFTYTVNSEDYSDGLYPYTATGVDNSSCSNTRTSDVKYLEVDHKGSIQPALQAQQQAAQQQAAQASAAVSSKLKDNWLFFLLLIGVVVYLIFFRKS